MWNKRGLYLIIIEIWLVCYYILSIPTTTFAFDTQKNYFNISFCDWAVCLYVSPEGNDDNNPCTSNYVLPHNNNNNNNRRLLEFSESSLLSLSSSSSSRKILNTPTQRILPPMPTDSPTQSPTRNPTFSPTRRPTKIPTHSPTKAPTKYPTRRPTAKPTKLPTRPPTRRPTFHPTISPTVPPTRTPSAFPTNYPTYQPTEAPTDAPTTPPSRAPTDAPSRAPTRYPTSNPTYVPTNHPTRTPSRFPTRVPTFVPTRHPSRTPSQYPTNSPSVPPTRAPSGSPTLPPTRSPSNYPTRTPSNSPSQPPTRAPSFPPTRSPSTAPTHAPFRAPTDSPTRTPSNAPTDAPSNYPTRVPSRTPSAYPTRSPSSAPTKAPTKPPTAAPTRVPSWNPSRAPTSAPSAAPTRTPSKHPTESPTNAPTLSPTARPTYTTCINLNYAINAAQEPNSVVVIQAGVYHLNYSINIINKTSLTIVAWDYENHTESDNIAYLLIDFYDPIWSNAHHAIRVKSSQHIRFENIVFIDRYYYKHNGTFRGISESWIGNRSFSLIDVSDSDDVSFWNTKFEGFLYNSTTTSSIVDDKGAETDYRALGEYVGFSLFFFESGDTLNDGNSTKQQPQYRYQFVDSFIGNMWFTQALIFRSVVGSPGLDGPTQLSFHSCTLMNIEVNETGAIMHLSDTAFQFINSSYQDNNIWIGPQSPFIGGGIILLFSEENRFNELFPNNKSVYGYNDINASIVWIDSSTFVNNSNMLKGGIFSVESIMETYGLMSISNCFFSENSVWKNGGVMHYRSYNYIANIVNDSMPIPNQVSLIAGLRLYVQNCTFIQNKVTSIYNTGDIIAPDEMDQGGGGVFHITLNHNTTGGIERVAQLLPALPENSSMPFDDELFLSNCVFRNNYVTGADQSGGALFMKSLLDDTNYSSANIPPSISSVHYHILHIDNNEFSYHSSDNSGGAIWFEYNEHDKHKDYKSVLPLYRHISIENSMFAHGYANHSAGAIFMRSGKTTVLIHECQFWNNTAYSMHGALSILMTSGVSATLDQCNFTGNSVINGNGGALAFDVDVSMEEPSNEFRRRALERSSKIVSAGAIPTPAMNPLLSTSTLIPTISPTTSRPTRNPTTGAEAEHSCSNISIAHSTFDENSASKGKGGAVFVNAFKDVRCINWIADDCVFRENQAMYGGGVAAVRLNQSSYHYGTMESNVTTIKFYKCIFDKNIAEYSGGHILMLGDTQSCDTMNVENNILDMDYCEMQNGKATLHGGGVSAYCSFINVRKSLWIENHVQYAEAGSTVDPKVPDDNTKKGSSGSGAKPEILAVDISDKTGGGGGAIYGYRSGMIVQDSRFVDNSVIVGNGGAIHRDWGVSLTSGNNIILGPTLYIPFVIQNNTFSNNRVNSSWVDTQNSVSECASAVMNGFGGAMWADVNGHLDGKVSKDQWSICDNIFSENTGLWVHQVYFSLFDKQSVLLLNQSYCENNTESNATYAVGTRSKGTSAIGFSSATLAGKSNDCGGEGCLGNVLPGDVLLIEISLRDAFGQDGISGMISCAQMYWSTTVFNSSSSSPTAVLQTDDFSFHPTLAHLEFKLQNAPIGAEEHILFNDTHNIFKEDLYVVTALCKDGTTTVIAGEVKANICEYSDMRDVSFQCGSECTTSQYLFNRWEPECHACPSSGAICDGGANITIEYGYYAFVNYSWMWTDSQHYVNVCTTTFDVFLCPVNLCCNHFDGCLFDGSDPSALCPKNRDPSVPFCGKCLPGYSEVIGDTRCDVCEETIWEFFFIPFGGGILLLTYFLVKDPTSVTPLFTYMYKSFLYFYQVLPVLTYQGYNELTQHLTSLMNLEFFGIASRVSGSQNFGTCLLKHMTNLEKLWMNLAFPLTLFMELVLLRLIPECLICCCDDDTKDDIPSNKLPTSPTTGNLLNATTKENEIPGEKSPNNNYHPPNNNWLSPQRSGSEDRSNMGDDQTSTGYPAYNSALHSHRFRKRGPQSESMLPVAHALTCSQKIRRHFHEALWNSLLITYIVVGESVIKLINCKEINGEYRLWNAGDITCYRTWQMVFVLLYICIVLFPILMFLRLWSLGWKYKAPGAATQIRYMQFAAFTMTYGKKRWWYESIMMGRRILLISIYSLPVNDPTLLRACMAFCCGCILAFHAYARPFRRKVNNFFETVLLTCLFIISILTMLDSSEHSISRTTQTWLSLVPLIFIPYLLYKYCHIKVYMPARQRWQSIWTLIRMKRNQIASENGDDYMKMEDDIEERESVRTGKQSIDDSELSLSHISMETDDVRRSSQKTVQMQRLKPQSARQANKKVSFAERLPNLFGKKHRSTADADGYMAFNKDGPDSEEENNLFKNPNEKLQKRNLKRRIDQTRNDMLQQQQARRSQGLADSDDDEPELSVLSENDRAQADVELVAQGGPGTYNTQTSYLVNDENGGYLEIKPDVKKKKKSKILSQDYYFCSHK